MFRLELIQASAKEPYKCLAGPRFLGALRVGLGADGISIRDEKLESVVIDAMAERLLRPDRLRGLLANLLDDSSAAVRERQAHLKALRTERTRIDGAIQNMFDFIEQGIVSARDTDFTARLAAQRTRRADIEQEILLVERQLSSSDRRVTPEAVARLGEVILTKLRSEDQVLRQGYARRFIAKVVVAPDVITITGPIKSLEIAATGDPEQVAPAVPSSAREWCPCATRMGTQNIGKFRYVCPNVSNTWGIVAC